MSRYPAVTRRALSRAPGRARMTQTRISGSEGCSSPRDSLEPVRGAALTHRSPLVTLAGLVIAFAVMFGVNITSSAPAGSYQSPGATPAAPAPSPTNAATTAAPPTATGARRPVPPRLPLRHRAPPRARTGAASSRPGSSTRDAPGTTRRRSRSRYWVRRPRRTSATVATSNPGCAAPSTRTRSSWRARTAPSWKPGWTATGSKGRSRSTTRSCASRSPRPRNPPGSIARKVPRRRSAGSCCPTDPRSGFRRPARNLRPHPSWTRTPRR